MDWSETRTRLIDCGVDAVKMPRKWQDRINLCEADLRGADLRWANLCEANLCEADLCEADLCEAKISHLTVGVHAAPEGDLIGWGCKSGHIIKLLIPHNSPRSCATTRKHRAAWVKTLEIDGGGMTRLEHNAEYGVTIYEVGEVTQADSWDENRWHECSGGIHFFLTREEAESWRG